MGYSNYSRKNGGNGLSVSKLLNKPRVSNLEVRPPKFIVVYRDQGGKWLKVRTVIGLKGPELKDAQKALSKMIHRGQIPPCYINGIKVIKNPECDGG